MKATQRGISSLNFNLDTLRNIAAYEVLNALPEQLGITRDDFERVKQGDRLLSEEEFCSILKVFVPTQSYYKGKTTMDWLLSPPNFGLVGILYPEYYVEKNTGEVSSKFQCFVEAGYAIVDNADLDIYEGDILVHDGLRRQKKFIVLDVACSHYESPHDPTYKLKVKRWNSEMHNNVHGNINIGSIGNINVGNYSVLSLTGDVIGTSIPHTAINNNSADIFAEARKLAETIAVDSRQDILEAIESMSVAKASGNEKEGRSALGKFLRATAKLSDDLRNDFGDVIASFKQMFK